VLDYSVVFEVVYGDELWGVLCWRWYVHVLCALWEIIIINNWYMCMA